MKFSDFRASASAPAPAAPAADDVRLTVPDEGLPLVVRPDRSDVNLAGWIAAHRSLVRDWVHRHAAVLFRGFRVGDATGMAACVDACSGESMEFREDTSPRSVVQGRVRTSTDYPADQRIVLHNEYSYSAVFPLRLFLYCATPPTEGGQTPLADCRRVYARLDPRIRDRFRERGWLYARHFVEGFGHNWQTVYQVSSRPSLEDYLRSAGIEWSWTERGTLKTRTRRQAIAYHPHTGEPVWFNHVLFWHVASLDPQLAALLSREYGEADLPHNTFYGDGAPIEPEVLDALRAAYDAEVRMFDWAADDFLIVDNMLAAHGRRPFEGPRRVLFAMAEPVSRAGVDANPRAADPRAVDSRARVGETGP